MCFSFPFWFCNSNDDIQTNKTKHIRKVSLSNVKILVVKQIGDDDKNKQKQDGQTHTKDKNREKGIIGKYLQICWACELRHTAVQHQNKSYASLRCPRLNPAGSYKPVRPVFRAIRKNNSNSNWGKLRQRDVSALKQRYDLVPSRFLAVHVT